MKIITSANQQVGQVNPLIYGHFLEHFQRQVYGGVYDPTSRFADEDGFRTDVLEALRNIKPTIMRWPGGCYASDYDWHLGVGKERTPIFDVTWRVEDTNEFGTDEFIKFCRKVGCEPYICTNAGTGTAKDMSNWVEYCNLKDMGRFARERIANGCEEPHGVKYWGIGNENWGSHEIGEKTVEEWSRLFQESAKMMLRVDPTVELSSAAYYYHDKQEWNFQLLQTAGKYLSWLSVHSYWTLAEDGVTFPPYQSLMQLTGRALSYYINRVRSHLVAFGLEDKIKIAYDEWNLRFWHHPYTFDPQNPLNKEKGFYDHVIAERSKNDINATYTMADAVFTACFLNTCLRNCDIVQMACLSPVVNGRGAIFTHEDGIVLRPQYFTFQLYANLMKDTVLDTWKEDVPTFHGTWDNKEEDIDLVDVAVTYGDGEYAIGAINKDADNSQTFDLTLLGGQLTEMRIHTVNGPSAESYNDIDKPEVGITVSEWMSFAGSVTLQPHSVNVIELR